MNQALVIEAEEPQPIVEDVWEGEVEPINPSFVRVKCLYD